MRTGKSINGEEWSGALHSSPSGFSLVGRLEIASGLDGTFTIRMHDFLTGGRTRTAQNVKDEAQLADALLAQ
ncbi:unnamed protein product, partial [Nippostrongylus brasiliensis]|uniref:Lipoprotein n=1 Tax=Nippostrongylus brasiliensis TaxID=27835 RepID=A0A0N4XQB2_NIPBR